MPRLLLVDDNPSIHRIAESLLSGTSVDLVCLESAEEALRRVDAGERFDVALLDTVLGPGGMDGWALLDRLRQMPATAKMPIALMAGVLDAVEPLRLEKALIQGFLRKPIELRDLEARIQTYMAAPVEGVGTRTAPGAKLQDWMSEAPAPPAPAPGPETESDLLVLTADDLLEPELYQDIHAPEPELHLEELDLSGLPGGAGGGMHEVVPEPEPELPSIPSLNLDEPLSNEMLAGLTPFVPMDFSAPVEPEPAPEPEPAMEMETLHGIDPEALFPGTPAVPAAPMESSAPALAPEPAMPLPAGDANANAMVQAILADPSARDALLKALLAQGGEQVLREVAWEVMPDLVSKLQK